MSDAEDFKVEAATTAVEMESMRRDIGTIADATRELHNNFKLEIGSLADKVEAREVSLQQQLDSRARNNRNSLISVVAIIVPALMATTGLILTFISGNTEDMKVLATRLRVHEIEAAYTRGRTDAALEKLEAVIDKPRTDEEVIERLIDKLQGKDK